MSLAAGTLSAALEVLADDEGVDDEPPHKLECNPEHGDHSTRDPADPEAEWTRHSPGCHRTNSLCNRRAGRSDSHGSGH